MIETIRHIEDASSLRRYQRDESSAFQGRTSRVFLPSSPAEVSETVRAASSAEETLTLRAAGTSITGAPVPTCGGWVLSTERMRSTEELPWPASLPDLGKSETVRGPDYSFALFENERLAVVPPGLRLFELAQSLERFGLVYPPDPTELSAMVGGTVATNASGARSYFYGATRNWVEALLVIFPNGKSSWISRGDFVADGRDLPLPPESGVSELSIPSEYPFVATKNAAGLFLRPGMDLVDLFIGSEGILGIIAGAVLRLTEKPQRVLQTAAFFPTESNAFDFATTLRNSDDVLSIEYFDASSLAFMKDHYSDLPAGDRSCVLFEVRTQEASSGNPYPPSSQLDSWIERLEAAGSTENWSVTAEDVAAMKEFRHSLPESVNRWVAAHKGKLGTDLSVPAEHFPELCRAYDTARRGGVRAVLFGHLGQYHLHLNFLPADDPELAEARRRYLELARKAVALGGTVSAEHGVGKKRLADETGEVHPYLYFMIGREGLESIRRIKALIDPSSLLNPDTTVPRA